VAVAPRKSYYAFSVPGQYLHAGAGLAAKGRHMCLSEHAAYVGVTLGFWAKRVRCEPSDMETSTPCIGFIPYSVAAFDSSTAALTLLWSVMAMAGMPHSAARATSVLHVSLRPEKSIVNERADGRRVHRDCLHVQRCDDLLGGLPDRGG